MIAFLRLLFFYLTTPVLFLSILLFYSLDKERITQNSHKLSRSEIQRAKQIVTKTTSKTRTTIRLSEKELNIALNYLLNASIQSSSEITVEKLSLRFKISLSLPNNAFGKYLNLGFNLTKKQGYPVIHSLYIGKIKIADEFAGLLLENIIKYTPLKGYYILAAQQIKEIQINAKDLVISYFEPTDLNLKNRLHSNPNLTHQDYQSVIFYQQQIATIIAQHNPKKRLSLADLLQPLFKLADQRSMQANAISENRAVLIAISTYVNKDKIQSYFPFNISPTTEQYYPASLYRRFDMAQHFMLSAVLAATGAETLTYILGEEKELSDAKQGSGFSFIDLASDKAGLKLGVTAVASIAQAKQLQQKMAKIKDYTAFMPNVNDLPEQMSERIFKQNFKSIHSVEYQAMLKKIDARISELAIYH